MPSEEAPAGAWYAEFTAVVFVVAFISHLPRLSSRLDLLFVFELVFVVVNVLASDGGEVPGTSFAPNTGFNISSSSQNSAPSPPAEDTTPSCLDLDQSALSKCFLSDTIRFFFGIIPPYFALSFSSCSLRSAAVSSRSSRPSIVFFSSSKKEKISRKSAKVSLQFSSNDDKKKAERRILSSFYSPLKKKSTSHEARFRRRRRLTKFAVSSRALLLSRFFRRRNYYSTPPNGTNFLLGKTTTKKKDHSRIKSTCLLRAFFSSLFFPFFCETITFSSKSLVFGMNAFFVNS